MEVPLACLTDKGEAGHDFKSSQIFSLLELTLCGLLDLSLNCVMFVAMAQKLSQDLAAHHLSNCLAFVI